MLHHVNKSETQFSHNYFL